MPKTCSFTRQRLPSMYGIDTDPPHGTSREVTTSPSRSVRTPITLSAGMPNSAAHTRTTGSADAEMIRTSKPLACNAPMRSRICG